MKNKTILIDAIGLHSSGGLILLRYITDELERLNIAYYLVTDDRPKKELKTIHYTVSHRTIFLTRSFFLNKLIKDNDFSCLLVFGNFPPSIRIKIPTYLYFQNTLLADATYDSLAPLSVRLKLIVQRFLIKINIKNIDFILFQTNTVKKIFLAKYTFNSYNCFVLPFFNIDKSNFDKSKKVESTYIYVSSNAYYKNYKNLLIAWELFSKDNPKSKLYLTIDKPVNFELFIYNSVIFLGQISHNEILKITNKCEYCLFPSFTETIGLGLVEAYIYKLKIICSNLPYVYDVVKPSLTFDPNNPISIYEALLKTKNNINTISPTQIVIENKINELIKILLK
jgi:glycosyltransferase involved in cell wall biosynthesis